MSGHRLTSLLVVLLLAAPLALMGCTGDDGDDGNTGAAGTDGAPGADGNDGIDTTQAISLAIDEPEALTIDVTGITIASPPVITFSLTDEHGRMALGLGTNTYSRGLRWVRFVMAKLVAGTDGDPDQWVRYTYEREPAGLVDNGDGTYTYTFEMDLGDYDAAIPYEPSLTHRLAIQSSSGSWDPINFTMDFVPDQLPGPTYVFPLTRDIVTGDACNECHGTLAIHGSRYEPKYCVTCHNPMEVGEADMTMMVHAIHAAGMRDEAYEIDGDDFSHVGYPQDLMHCTKCHTGPDADNWKTRPSMWACSSCHDEVDFSGDGDHIAQASNAACDACHQPDGGGLSITVAHATENPTEHNPQLPEGGIAILYEIDGVTVDGDGVPTVKFRIMTDGTPATLNTYSEGDEIMLAGMDDRSPGFLLAWAVPQDGIEKPADYNNMGNTAGQPTSIGLDDVWNGSEGTLTGPDADGWYMAEITGGAFPAGAMLRAVALQGYFRQIVGEGTLSRHTISVIDWADENDARRDIVDDAKCASCHEWFEGHGGNRVYTTQVCATCHVPNLSSSGRTLNLTGHVPGAPDDLIPGSTSSFNSSTDNTVATLGDDPLTYPEETNNFKDLIHGIHAAHDRENHYTFVRVRGGNGYYFDFSHVTFPTDANKCLTCHKPGTYMPEEIPAGALWTNNKTTTGNEEESRTDIVGARGTLPNPTDLVNSPIASTCYGCHDTAASVAHMEQNGGFIRWVRQDALDWMPMETCTVCHGEGKIADVELMHEDD